jgi:hypothetical protein
VSSVNLNSSVGYRLITVFSCIDYFINGSYLQVFFGEGFLNFHSWIYAKYSFLGGTMIEDGDVTNLLAVIFLSGGILGTVIFLFYISSLINQVSKENKIYLFTFIFSFMLVYGNITAPHFYLFTYIFLIFFNKKNAF